VQTDSRSATPKVFLEGPRGTTYAPIIQTGLTDVTATLVFEKELEDLLRYYEKYDKVAAEPAAADSKILHANRPERIEQQAAAYKLECDKLLTEQNAQQNKADEELDRQISLLRQNYNKEKEARGKDYAEKLKWLTEKDKKVTEEEKQKYQKLLMERDSKLHATKDVKAEYRRKRKADASNDRDMLDWLIADTYKRRKIEREEGEIVDRA
jgi:hypothetical protein